MSEKKIDNGWWAAANGWAFSACGWATAGLMAKIGFNSDRWAATVLCSIPAALSFLAYLSCRSKAKENTEK